MNARWVYRAGTVSRFSSAAEPDKKISHSVEIYPLFPEGLPGLVDNLKKKSGSSELLAMVEKMRSAEVEILKTQAPGNYKSTFRYKNHLANTNLYFDTRLGVIYNLLSLYKTQMQTSDYIWIRWYPFSSQSPLFRTGSDDGWDVDDKAPQPSKPAGQP